MTTMRIPVLLLMAMVATGCYDAPTVDPYPGSWLIDDFEDRNGYPADPRFERWGCSPSPVDAGPQKGVADCEVILDPNPEPPDFPESMVLHLGATLLPPEGSTDTFTRAEVFTWLRGEQPYDLQRYQYLSFRWKLIFGSAKPPTIYLIAQLLCERARSSNGGVSTKPFVVDQITATALLNNWKELVEGVAAFEPKGTGTLDNIAVEEADCLAHVNGIKITVDSGKSLSPDFPARFDLYIDDIKLIPNR